MWTVEQGDCLAVLRTLPDECIDSVVTDPPAGISFMGKAWDADKGGPAEWIAWLRDVMAECLRVLKPGGHALVWAIPRTSHWTGMACELAGFEVRDVVTHLFGSGFPKSLNVSKAIDAADGLKGAREVVSTYTAGGNAGVTTAEKGGTYGVGVGTAAPVELAITRGASERSRAWDGWGTALKPAAEMWWLVRKPLAVTVAANVLEHGTGAINVDGCRVGTDVVGGGGGGRGAEDGSTWNGNTCGLKAYKPRPVVGRWPANIVLSHSSQCVPWNAQDCDIPMGEAGHCSCGAHHTPNEPRRIRCHPDCPIAMLDAQSGNRPGMSGGGKHRPDATPGMFGAIDCTHTARGDSGGASRFFYCAKTSTREREAGLDALPKRLGHDLVDREPDTAGLANPRAGAGRTSKGRANSHPTVKPLDLMRYLVRLITPPGGVVLDPFCGSGSTGAAAVAAGFTFCGIEQDKDYCDIARARIAHWEDS